MRQPTKINTVQIPPVSREYAETLDKIFRATEIKHDTPDGLIRYQAGQRSVVEYVLRTSVHREVTGEPAKLRHNQQKLSFFQRLFLGVKGNEVS